MDRFDALLHAVLTKGSPPDRRRSRPVADDGYSDTRIPSRNSEGVFGTREHEVPRIDSFRRAQNPSIPLTWQSPSTYSPAPWFTVSCSNPALGQSTVGFKFVGMNRAACRHVLFDDRLKCFLAYIRDNVRHNVAAALPASRKPPSCSERHAHACRQSSCRQRRFRRLRLHRPAAIRRQLPPCTLRISCAMRHAVL